MSGWHPGLVPSGRYPRTQRVGGDGWETACARAWQRGHAGGPTAFPCLTRLFRRPHLLPLPPRSCHKPLRPVFLLWLLVAASSVVSGCVLCANSAGPSVQLWSGPPRGGCPCPLSQCPLGWHCPGRSPASWRAAVAEPVLCPGPWISQPDQVGQGRGGGQRDGGHRVGERLRALESRLDLGRSGVWAAGTYLGSRRLTAGQEGPSRGVGLAVLSRQWSSKRGSFGPGTPPGSGHLCGLQASVPCLCRRHVQAPVEFHPRSGAGGHCWQARWVPGTSQASLFPRPEPVPGPDPPLAPGPERGGPCHPC